MDRLWDQLQQSDTPPPKEDMAKWEAQFKDLMDSQRADLDYDTYAEESWREQNRQNFDEHGLPILEPYAFGKPVLPLI